jgi:hypothetical protein
MVQINAEIMCFLVCWFLYIVELDSMSAVFILRGLCFCYVWPAVSSLEAIYLSRKCCGTMQG